MILLTRGWLARAVVILLVVGLATVLVTGCSAVGIAEDAAGGGNPWGVPWWGWLLIGIVGAAILL